MKLKLWSLQVSNFPTTQGSFYLIFQLAGMRECRMLECVNAWRQVTDAAGGECRDAVSRGSG